MAFSAYRVFRLVHLTTYLKQFKVQLMTNNQFTTVVILFDQCSFTNTGTLKSHVWNTMLQVSFGYFKVLNTLF